MKKRSDMVKITKPSGDKFVWQDEYDKAERNALIYAAIACAGLYCSVMILVYFWLTSV